MGMDIAKSVYMVFGAFAKTVDSVASAAIYRMVEMQGQMLVDDVVSGRTDFNDDIFSILCFWRYLAVAKEGRTLGGFAAIPYDQVAFYKKTIRRMITANELPLSAMTAFDAIPEISVSEAEGKEEIAA